MVATFPLLPHNVIMPSTVTARVCIAKLFFSCDFGMKFTYVLTGWEGSTMDARVFQDACT